MIFLHEADLVLQLLGPLLYIDLRDAEGDRDGPSRRQDKALGVAFNDTRSTRLLALKELGRHLGAPQRLSVPQSAQRHLGIRRAKPRRAVAFRLLLDLLNLCLAASLQRSRDLLPSAGVGRRVHQPPPKLTSSISVASFRFL